MARKNKQLLTLLEEVQSSSSKGKSVEIDTAGGRRFSVTAAKAKKSGVSLVPGSTVLIKIDQSEAASLETGRVDVVEISVPRLPAQPEVRTTEG